MAEANDASGVPTAAAWLALMADNNDEANEAPDDLVTEEEEPKGFQLCTPGFRGTKDRAPESFWSKYDVDILSGHSASLDIEENDTKSTKATASIFGLLHCGPRPDSNQKKVTFEEDEEIPTSPCAMIRNEFHAAVMDVEFEDEEFYYLTSDDERSHGSDDGSSSILSDHEDDILDELHQEIPFLRERSDLLYGTSKYKQILKTSKEGTDDSESVHSESYDETPAKLPTFEKSSRKTQKSFKFNHRRLKVDMKESRDSTKSTTTNSEPQATDDLDQKPHQRQTSTLKTLTLLKQKLEDNVSVEATSMGDVPTNGNTTQERPMSTVAACLDDETASENGLIHGMSTLTNDDQYQLALLDPPKMCVPPALLKKFHSLKQIKLAKSKSTSSSHSSKSFLKRIATVDEDEGTNKEGSPFIYEYFSRIHSYVAFFRRGTRAMESIKLYEHPTPAVFPTVENEVVVKIEASTVSATDCLVRRGEFWNGKDGSEKALKLPIIPGVAFVGVVRQTTKSGYRTNFREGDRVISLVHTGANARHISISSDQLVKVPEQIHDSCALACLPEAYLTAFQALHIGQRSNARYRKTSLSGKCVLVLGGATAMGRAMIELAISAGCATVYATGKRKQFAAISALGGAPLGRDPMQWRSTLRGRVDLVLGLDGSIGDCELREEHMGLLSATGKIVLLAAPGRTDDGTSSYLDESEDVMMRETIQFYNVFDSWDVQNKQCKRDLSHLIKLVGDQSIKPKILERIPLNRVAKAQDLMDGKKLHGYIMCEPWMQGRKDPVPPFASKTSGKETMQSKLPRMSKKFSDAMSSLKKKSATGANSQVPLIPLNEAN